MEVNLLIAFIAGLLSFFAPCVIPLLPSYISFISGVSLVELDKNAQKYRRVILINSLIYIIGFSLIFVSLGLGVSFLSKLLIVNRFRLLKLGGLLIILFGFYELGIFDKFQFLQVEKRITFPKSWQKLSYIKAFLAGVIFSLAWTPCIGAVLGAILTLAATSTSIMQGAILLFVYSLGISLPFLVIALTLGNSYPLIKFFFPRLKMIKNLGGILLLIVGVLILFQF